MRWLSQRMWRKGLSREHLRSLSAPSTLLVSPPIPHSSAAACRHACSFPGQLCRRHLAGTCLWGPPYSTPVGDVGQPKQLIPVGHIPSQPCQAGAAQERRWVSRYIRLLLTACLCL